MAPTITFCEVISEAKRIINANSRYFLALSVLFLLPPSSLSLILSLFQYQPTASDLSLQTLLPPLAYSLLVLLLSLSSTIPITCSTYHAFYGGRLTLASAFKSLAHSFFPMIATSIAIQFLVFLLFAAFVAFLLLVTKGVQILGLEIEYNSPYYVGFCAVVLIVFVLVVVYLQVNWVLASAIVVVESKWGFEALRRSTHLVKGKGLRLVSLSLMLFFGVFGVLGGLLLWGILGSVSFAKFGDVWDYFWFIFYVVVGSGIQTLLSLSSVASFTVLYCKALNGELGLEMAPEFGGKYASVPLDLDDDGKVAHIV